MAESSNQFLGIVGLQYLWDKIVGTFVKKDGRKVLSDNNFTDEEKEKLSELETFMLPEATGEVLGGVKIGSGLTKDAEGRLTAERYTLPVATAHTLGGISVGAGLEIDGNGTLSSYLPTATSNTLGGVKIGSGLTMSGEGVLSASETVQWNHVVNPPTTLSGYGITDAASSDTVANVSSSVTELGNQIGNILSQEKVDLLLADSISDTTQTIAFTNAGEIDHITHSSGGSTVRTDTFTFGQNQITERRVLSTGESLTIVTNTETLVTTLTYAAA